MSLSVHLTRPWLLADLGRPRRVLSFAPHRPGFATADRIVWREVRNADLPPELDVETWFSAELAQNAHSAAVAMLTSRDIGRYQVARTKVAGICVGCVATVGLGNAERIGSRRTTPRTGHGTINIAVLAETGLTDTAMLEAMTIVAEARTAAVIEAGLMLPGGPATGTGTDCIALAADVGCGGYAGLHTALGEAIGRAVHAAVTAGAQDWMAEQGFAPNPTRLPMLEEANLD
ncbi:adenosylcobinamide amidohydrolase [Candidatus Falkowbacteria bacterium]|nr:adenosylcobinamide amidohydrolase [Candidatus Falkowbacteria bacterium]